MNATWMDPLTRLVDQDLFEKRQDVVAHHFAHQSPEGWLVLEIAYLFNTWAERPDGWEALVEHGKYDLSFVPPLGEPLLVEAKLCAPHSWRANWGEVRDDLSDRPKKSAADYALCFAYRVEPADLKHQSTIDEYERYWRSLPEVPGPIDVPDRENDGGALHAVVVGRTHILPWRRPVQWRHKNSPTFHVRLMWVARGPE